MEIFLTRKKTLFYYFLLTKREEEEEEEEREYEQCLYPQRVKNIGRELVEIRDYYAPPELDPNNPWTINKILNQHEITRGQIVISFTDMFDHVLRYWGFEMAHWIVTYGRKIGVRMWDVTREKNPKKYNSEDVYMQQMKTSYDFILSCPELVEDRNLKAGDKICMYWDSKEESLKVKLV